MPLEDPTVLESLYYRAASMRIVEEDFGRIRLNWHCSFGLNVAGARAELGAELPGHQPFKPGFGAGREGAQRTTKNLKNMPCSEKEYKQRSHPFLDRSRGKNTQKQDASQHFASTRQGILRGTHAGGSQPDAARVVGCSPLVKPMAAAEHIGAVFYWAGSS